MHVEALLEAGADPSRPTPDGLSAYRLALQFGLTEVAALLQAQTGAPEISDDEQFIAACARGDEAGARPCATRRPDLPGCAVGHAIALAAGHGSGGGNDAVG